jgi:regulator of sigma E protease
LGLIQNILAVIVVLGLLITFHEYGHFWVARRCGVKVLRFSVGFGKPIWSRVDRHGTEFAIAAIPLGGYVKMLDEREAPVPDDQLDQAFNRKTVWQRIAIVAARGRWPTSCSPSLPRDVRFRLLDRLGDSGTIRLSLRDPGADYSRDVEVPIDRWLAGEEAPDLLTDLGLASWSPPVPPVVAETVAGGAAEAAGVLAGDRLLTADGVPLDDWMAWVEHVRARPGQAIAVTLERQGQPVALELVPAPQRSTDGRLIGQVGMAVTPPEIPAHLWREVRFGPVTAIAEAGRRTGELIEFTLVSIKKMLTGLISHKNLSGPITIAKVASASAESGWANYIAFLALLSISLGVLNLLPIPVLDGGHLVFYTIELVAGRPVPARVEQLGYQLGLAVVLGIMVLALYNDVTRLL